MDSGFLGAILGAVVGAAASVVTTMVAARNSIRLQEHSDSLLRRERAREFQRTTLLELQEALVLNARLFVRAHLEDAASFRKNPTAKPMLSDKLDDELAQSNRRVSLLTERVADDPLRERIKEVRKLMDKVVIARSLQESQSAAENFPVPFQGLMEHLGTVLRSHY